MAALCASLLAGGLLQQSASSRTSRPVLLAQADSLDGTAKGLATVALVELGSGCCHGEDDTKAAVRACNAAVEWASIKVRNIIPGGYEAMKLHVHLATPNPAKVDLERVADCFPYGELCAVQLERGGLLASSRGNLAAAEPAAGRMTVANVCVTVGW